MRDASQADRHRAAVTGASSAGWNGGRHPSACRPLRPSLQEGAIERRAAWPSGASAGRPNGPRSLISGKGGSGEKYSCIGMHK